MSVRNLDKLFKPAAVALIGATPRHGSLGAVLFRNLRRGAFGGPLMLVNPHHRSIDGVPVHRDIASLPEVPDLAVSYATRDRARGDRRPWRSWDARGSRRNRRLRRARCIRPCSTARGARRGTALPLAPGWSQLWRQPLGD